MKIKSLFLVAALLFAANLSAQPADVEAIVKDALDRADIATTVHNAIGRVSSMVQVGEDTVIVSAGKHRVVVVERNEDGSRTEVAYFKEERSGHSSDRHASHPRRISGSMMIDMSFSIYDQRNIFTNEKGGEEFAPQHTSKSFGVAIYPLMGHLRFNRANTYYLTSGLGLDLANYRFEDDYTIRNIGGVTRPAPFGKRLDKSKLQTTYLNVPLILGARIPVSRNSDSGIRLEAGVIGGLKLGAHTKWKYAAGGKDKEHGSFNLNMLRYQLTARAGYGSLTAFFNYQMTPMFKSGHGAELYPYQVGLSWRFGSTNF